MANIFGYPSGGVKKYNPSDWNQTTWDALQDILSDDGLQRGMERSAMLGLGRAQSTGYRQAVGQFGNDPALLSNVMTKLQRNLGRGYTEASSRGAIAGAQRKTQTLGQMSNMAQMRESIEQAMREMEERRRERREQFRSDIFGGLIGLGGSLGGAAIGRSGQLGAARILQRGSREPTNYGGSYFPEPD